MSVDGAAPPEPEHEVTGVEYMPCCETCGAPVTLADDDKTWEHCTPAALSGQQDTTDGEASPS